MNAVVGTGGVGAGPSDRRLSEIAHQFFGVRDAAAFDALLGDLELVRVPGGSWLFRENDLGDSLFLIVRGRLQVWREGTADEARDGAHLLGELSAGDSVGEVALLAGGSRSASVRAIRDSLLLRMDRQRFERLALAHPALGLELTRQMAIRLRDRTGTRPTMTRGLENLAVLPIGEGRAVRGFAAALAKALERLGSVLHVDAKVAGDGNEASLAEWVHEQESRHRFLVLEAEPRRSRWSQLCRRQADVQLLVADAAEPVSAGPWAVSGPDDGGAARRILVLLHAGHAVSRSARWLDTVKTSEHHHLRAGSMDRDLARLARVLAGEALGLVLGGGGARGFAHIGAFRALREAGIEVDLVGGSSIGAVFAAALALDWSVEKIENVAREAFVEENPFGDYTIPLVSLVAGRRLKRLVLEHFDLDIEDLPLPYFCTSSQLDRGGLNVHERGVLWRAVRASVALPGVLPPVVIDRRLSIDGGILNNLPVDVMRARSAGRVLAVDLSAHKDRTVDYDDLPTALSLLRSRAFPGRERLSVPNIVSLIMKSSLVASAAHTRAMREEADLLLNPPVGEFGLMDVRSFDRLVEVGYQHARDRIAKWGHPDRSLLEVST
jgi:predicted acylesterase/phospholipase RssA/CRP-like cAMP-binding protein